MSETYTWASGETVVVKDKPRIVLVVRFAKEDGTWRG